MLKFAGTRRPRPWPTYFANGRDIKASAIVLDGLFEPVKSARLISRRYATRFDYRVALIRGLKPHGLTSKHRSAMNDTMVVQSWLAGVSRVLDVRKRQQAAHLYLKKRLLDIALALPRKSREGPPLPGPLLLRRRGSRLGGQSAKRLGGAFGRGWFSKAAASCAHSIRFARYGPGGEGGSRPELAP